MKITIEATFSLNYYHVVVIPDTQREEISEGRLRPKVTHIFPWAPKIPARPKYFSCMDNTGHTSGEDEGFGGQSFLSVLKLRNQVKGEKLVIWFPPLVLSWESGRNERCCQDLDKERGREWCQQVKREREKESDKWKVAAWSWNQR